MPTQFQLAANRANAASSTGPQTAEGRAASSRNALSHGLTSSVLLHRDENSEQFALFREIMLADLAPDSAVELFFADRIITNAWRLRRAIGIESELLTLSHSASPSADSSPEANPSASRSSISQMTRAWLDDSVTENFRKLNRHEAHINSVFTRDYSAYLKRRQIRRDAEYELAHPFPSPFSTTATPAYPYPESSEEFQNEFDRVISEILTQEQQKQNQ